MQAKVSWILNKAAGVRFLSRMRKLKSGRVLDRKENHENS